MYICIVIMYCTVCMVYGCYLFKLAIKYKNSELLLNSYNLVIVMIHGIPHFTYKSTINRYLSNNRRNENQIPRLYRRMN